MSIPKVLALKIATTFIKLGGGICSNCLWRPTTTTTVCQLLLVATLHACLARSLLLLSSYSISMLQHDVCWLKNLLGKFGLGGDYRKVLGQFWSNSSGKYLSSAWSFEVWSLNFEVNMDMKFEWNFEEVKFELYIAVKLDVEFEVMKFYVQFDDEIWLQVMKKAVTLQASTWSSLL